MAVKVMAGHGEEHGLKVGGPLWAALPAISMVTGCSVARMTPISPVVGDNPQAACLCQS